MKRGAKTANPGSFKPGQSGNPGGRRHTPPEIRELLRKNTPEAFAKLWEICCEDDDRRVQLTALMYWIDRDLGKPREAEAEDPEKAPDEVVVEKAREALRLIEGGKAS